MRRISEKRLQLQLERKLLQELQTLKPLLPLITCYRQTPVGNEKRLKTAPCTFSNYTPQLKFEVQQSSGGWLLLTLIELNGSAFPLAEFNQYGFFLEHKNEYFLLKFPDYQVLNRVQSYDWEKEAFDQSRFIADVLGPLAGYPVNRNNLLISDQVDVIPPVVWCSAN